MLKVLHLYPKKGLTETEIDSVRKKDHSILIPLLLMEFGTSDVEINEITSTDDINGLIEILPSLRDHIIVLGHKWDCSRMNRIIQTIAEEYGLRIINLKSNVI